MKIPQALILGAVLGAFFGLITKSHAATPGDNTPSATYGAVQVVCDDGGTTNATPIPATPLNQRNSVSIQNNGPAPIYCGFSSAVTQTSGTQVVGSGGFLNIDIKHLNQSATGTLWNPVIYCKQATCTSTIINQVADGGPSDTRYMEVR